MTWHDVFKITAALFTSIGGASAIIFGLSSWLGKVWANRILEADKIKYQSEFEVIKRYSEKQFYLYSDLWSSLCDLRIARDELWRRATVENATKFAGQLKKTEDQVTRSSLLIEEEHYESLKRVMSEFGRFATGKVRLIDLRERQPFDVVNDHHILASIGANGETKTQYTRLLAELERSFKRQLRGTI